MGCSYLGNLVGYLSSPRSLAAVTNGFQRRVISGGFPFENPTPPKEQLAVL